MPYCAILECKNHSRTTNMSHGGISYHRFPTEPNIRSKWLDATGRTNWFPTKTSVVCSKHFCDTDFSVKKSGHRYIHFGIVPTKNIVKIFTDTSRDEVFNLPTTTEGLSTLKSEKNDDESQKMSEDTMAITAPNETPSRQEVIYIKSEGSNEEVVVVKIPATPSTSQNYKFMRQNVNDEQNVTPSNDLALRYRKLVSTVKAQEGIIKKQRLCIKRLQLENRRLLKKVKPQRPTIEHVNIRKDNVAKTLIL